MSKHHPYQVIGYHSCDRDLGLEVLKGKVELAASNNPWDWLGPGIYFWEHDPLRALTYAQENAKGKQFNKEPIKIPFVLGAIIELGNCLNLVESESLEILAQAYNGLKETSQAAGNKLPRNAGANRALDCAVIKYIHQSNQDELRPPYQTVRSAFSEGKEVYPGASFSTRHHIQIAVLDPSLVKGYFLPQPVHQFNPFLEK